MVTFSRKITTSITDTGGSNNVVDPKTSNKKRKINNNSLSNSKLKSKSLSSPLDFDDENDTNNVDDLDFHDDDNDNDNEISSSRKFRNTRINKSIRHNNDKHDQKEQQQDYTDVDIGTCREEEEEEEDHDDDDDIIIATLKKSRSDTTTDSHTITTESPTTTMTTTMIHRRTSYKTTKTTKTTTTTPDTSRKSNLTYNTTGKLSPSSSLSLNSKRKKIIIATKAATTIISSPHRKNNTNTNTNNNVKIEMISKSPPIAAATGNGTMLHIGRTKSQRMVLFKNNNKETTASSTSSITSSQQKQKQQDKQQQQQQPQRSVHFMDDNNNSNNNGSITSKSLSINNKRHRSTTNHSTSTSYSQHTTGSISFGNNNYNNSSNNEILLYDEFNFLCSSIISVSSTRLLLSLQQQQHQQQVSVSSSTCGAVTTNEKQYYTTIFNSLATILQIISIYNNRIILFVQPYNTKNNESSINHNTGSTGRDTPLDNLLRLFVWVLDFIELTNQQLMQIQQQQQSSAQSVHRNNNNNNNNRSKGRKNRDDDVQDLIVQQQEQQQYILLLKQRRQKILDVMNMILYYISFDCTLATKNDFGTNSNSANNAVAVPIISIMNKPKVARKIRKAILSNHLCLQGIVSLIVDDQFTKHIRTTASNNTCTTTCSQGTDTDSVSFLLESTQASSTATSSLLLSSSSSIQSQSPRTSPKRGKRNNCSQSSLITLTTPSSTNTTSKSSIVSTWGKSIMKDIVENNKNSNDIVNSNNKNDIDSSTMSLMSQSSLEESQSTTISIQNNSQELSIAGTVDTKTSITSSTSTGSTNTNGSGTDPTKAGRRRTRTRQQHIQNRNQVQKQQQQQRSLPSIQENQQLQLQSSVQHENDMNETYKMQIQVDIVATKILEELCHANNPMIFHSPTTTSSFFRTTCSSDEDNDTTNAEHVDYATYMISSWLPLLALNRIITGKYESGSNEKSCIDEEFFSEEEMIAENKGTGGYCANVYNDHTTSSSYDKNHNNNHNNNYKNRDKDEMLNPLLATNIMLGDASGVLQSLSQAMAETLAACITTLQVLRRNNEAISSNMEMNEIQKEEQKQVILNFNNRTNNTNNSGLDGCMQFLHTRINMISSLVDGASLLNESNRHILCKEGYTAEFDGSLVVALVSFLNSIMILTTIHANNNKNNNTTTKSTVDDTFLTGHLGEIFLCVVRTLTSLTHENSIAAMEMERALPHQSLLNTMKKVVDITTTTTNDTNDDDRHDEKESMKGFSLICGLDIIAQVLFISGTTCYNDSSTTPDAYKLKYDTVNFCLNILANIIESGAGYSRIDEVKIYKVHQQQHQHDTNKCCKMFLSWLTEWLVNETSSFRNDVVLHDATTSTMTTFGAEGKFENTDSERLVTAGNGFVLLSCLLIKDYHINKSNNKLNMHTTPTTTTTMSTLDCSSDVIGNNISTTTSLSSGISNIILFHVPGIDNSTKIQYIRNILVAFCNFYQYSLGDLSVAIVAPVKVIISRLDEMIK